MGGGGQPLPLRGPWNCTSPVDPKRIVKLQNFGTPLKFLGIFGNFDTLQDKNLPPLAQKKTEGIISYLKIPDISPGPTQLHKGFWVGLQAREIISGGAFKRYKNRFEMN